MWRRRCRILGTDPFKQMLKDIATVYDPEAWTTLAREFGTGAKTERQNRRKMKQAIDLVICGHVVFASIIHDPDMFIISYFCLFFFQRDADSPSFVDKDGLVSLGNSTFLSVSQIITRKKVKDVSLLMFFLSAFVPVHIYG